MITAISPSLLCTDVWKHVFYMSDTEAESESSICETWCKMWFSLQRQNETLRKLFSVVENATHSLHATLESDHRCAKSATFLISYNIYLLLLLSIVVYTQGYLSFFFQFAHLLLFYLAVMSAFTPFYTFLLLNPLKFCFFILILLYYVVLYVLLAAFLCF